jgi:phosphate transport system permease protein
MSEYVKDGWPKKIIKQMTNNLAGVPSIVLGFGMSLFVNKLEFGDSILAGGLTLLVLPVIIRTTEESLKAVDDTFRQASFGLGASKWETT